ncbi:MAG TPA: sigma-70 family RNA polymerase sigma factor [Isosphaeraceae bacterium]|nr:sigma-70 family RNA polymerase sigma factor [Isosphaeraceae bacterium]
MTAMQGMLRSKPAGSGSRSTPGRSGRSDTQPRDRALGAAASVPDETTQAQIYRQSRRGVSVEALAAQFGLSRSRIERVLKEMRAKRLLETPLEFIGDPNFDDPAAVVEILGPAPEPAADHGSRRLRALDGLPPYLAGLYDFPLLSREEERYLFRKMNYLKYRAHQLRAALDPSHCDAAQLDEIEHLQHEALAVKNQLIRANLRLVVSIAKKLAGPTNPLFELVSDGNMSLIRAVEKFDARRGFKFSTYASWAILKNFRRSIPEERRRRNRFVIGHDESFEIAPEIRRDASEQESDHRRNQEIVERMLGRLDSRERRVLISRYGIGGAAAQTLEQLGRELGVSKERVRQIQSQAQEKLRKIAFQEKLDLAFD